MLIGIFFKQGYIGSALLKGSAIVCKSGIKVGCNNWAIYHKKMTKIWHKRVLTLIHTNLGGIPAASLNATVEEVNVSVGARGCGDSLYKMGFKQKMAISTDGTNWLHH